MVSDVCLFVCQTLLFIDDNIIWGWVLNNFFFQIDEKKSIKNCNDISFSTIDFGHWILVAKSCLYLFVCVNHSGATITLMIDIWFGCLWPNQQQQQPKKIEVNDTLSGHHHYYFVVVALLSFFLINFFPSNPFYMDFFSVDCCLILSVFGNYW